MLFFKTQNFLKIIKSVLQNTVFLFSIIDIFNTEYTNAELFSINEEIYQKNLIKNTALILLELKDFMYKTNFTKDCSKLIRDSLHCISKIQITQYFPTKNYKETKKIYDLWLDEYKENIDYFSTLIATCLNYSYIIIHILKLYAKNNGKTTQEKIDFLINSISSIPNYVFKNISTLFQSEFDKKIIFKNENLEKFKEKLDILQNL